VGGAEIVRVPRMGFSGQEQVFIHLPKMPVLA
jgi:hypothetical protein